MKKPRFLKKLEFRITAAATAIIPSAFISKENTKFIDSECLKEPNKEMTLIQKIREDESFRLVSSSSSFFSSICYCSAENEPHYHNKLS